MKKNVVVTGGAGFLGSHLALRHLNVGDRVLIIDDHSTSMGLESRHFKRLQEHKNCNVFCGDISKDQHVYAAFNQWSYAKNFEKTDLIYNFACPASPPKYQQDPIQTMMTCVNGTNHMLQFAKYDGARVVHASTSEIYGDPLVSPQPESYWGNVNSFGIRSCYDVGKRASETICHDYIHKHNVDIRIVRIFNTYGPHMHPDDGRVVTNFVKQALRGEDITIYGDGSQTRSFCYVDDLINGIIALANLENKPQTPVNIGNPHEYTVLQLAKMVISETNSSSRIVHKDLPQDDPQVRKPDISLAKELLDFSPKVEITNGLKFMIEYMQSVL